MLFLMESLRLFDDFTFGVCLKNPFESASSSHVFKTPVIIGFTSEQKLSLLFLKKNHNFQKIW